MKTEFDSEKRILLPNILGKGKWLTEAVILAIIPLAGFIIAYFYERGFSSVYSFPPSMIVIDIKSSFLPIFSTIVILFFIYIYIFKFSIDIYVNEAIYNLYIAILISILLMLILKSFFLFKALIIAKPVKMTSLIYFSICLISLPFLIFERKKEKRKTRDLAHQKVHLFKMLILQILLIIIFVNCLGVFIARIKVNYLTFKLNHDEELVLLKKYGEVLICAPFLRNSKKVYKSFYFIEISNSDRIKFKFEKVGPLNSDN